MVSKRTADLVANKAKQAREGHRKGVVTKKEMNELFVLARYLCTRRAEPLFRPTKEKIMIVGRRKK